VVAVKIDSKWEAERWAELHILQKAGEIRNLKRQVPIRLAFNGKPVTYESGRKMTYWVDFDYDEKCDGKWVRVLEDTKGIDTKDSKIKRALVHNMLDIRVRTNFRADRAG
jgi:hypothetical protein